MDKTEIIKTAIEKADLGESKLTDEILSMEGMSSNKVKHFLNNLISLSKDVRYLEVGTWKGSTFVSALYGNEYTNAVGIDNFTEFHLDNDVKEALIANVDKFIPDQSSMQFCESDFRKVELGSMSFNIYLYDGGHSEQDQCEAFTLMDKYLDDEFIAIVDDWNMDAVKQGTYYAFGKLGYRVVFYSALPATYNGDVINWWDGLYVAHIKKGGI